MRKYLDITLRAALCMAVCAPISSAALAKGIASTSLCGDAYVMAVAGDDISALSWQSRDALSLAPEPFKTLPQAWDDAERLIDLSPELVIFGAGEGQTSAPILKTRQIKTMSLTWGEDFAAVTDNLRAVGKAAGRSPQAEQAIADLEGRRAALAERAQSRGHAPSILYLSRSGGTAGPGTFVDTAIGAAGGENVITAPGWASPDPEFLITLEPDLILTSFFKAGYESAQSNGVRHSAVQRMIRDTPSAHINGQLWPCAGPQLIDAAEAIADAIDELGRGS